MISALEQENGQLLAKLEESPFYPEGGGQVSDSGVVETESGRGVVVDVYRLGDDQAVALRDVEGELGQGQRARAVVDRATRFATMSNHTATHLLHAALRERLGTHVRQAGSYVGPDKLRFDFTHGERLSKQELADVEDAVNAWIVENHPVRAVHTSREEAERLGAMALFGEKYGDWVRMVDVEGVSRELCGGTHVGSTAEVGLFHVTHETSSASNVRRIEALTAEGGIKEFRRRTEEMRALAEMLRVPEHEVVNAVRRMQASLKEAQQGAEARRSRSGEQAEQLAGRAEEIGGVRVLTEVAEAPEPKALLALSDQLRQKLGDSAVVLGAGGRRARAPGRELRAGGRRARAERRRCRFASPPRSPEVAAADARRSRRPAARTRTSCRTRSPRRAWRSRSSSPDANPRAGRGRSPLRLRGLRSHRDGRHAARGGLAAGHQARTRYPRPPRERSRRSTRSWSACRSRCAGRRASQARWTRRFAERLAERVDVPVAMHDERLTTRQAERSGGASQADSRAAAHLLEAFLMSRTP